MRTTLLNCDRRARCIAAKPIGPSAREQPLVELIQKRLGTFAHGSDPWPRYDGSRYQVLDLSPSIGTHLKDDVCDFWDSLL